MASGSQTYNRDISPKGSGSPKADSRRIIGEPGAETPLPSEPSPCEQLKNMGRKAIASKTKRENVIERPGDPRLQFFQGLRDCPERFLHVLRTVRLRLWSRQLDAYYALWETPQVYVRSGNAVGKTFLAGVLGCAFLFVRQPSRVVYIATKIEQTRRQAWSEFLRCYRAIRERLAMMSPPLVLPEPLAQSVDLVPGEWFATVWGGVAATPEAFHGFHAEHLLFVIDEASGVPDPVREAVERCLTTEGSRLLALGNPVRRSGWFYEHQQDPPPYRRVIRISALETPNVIQGRTVVPGLATREWVERIRAEYGEDSPFWQVSVLGEFPQAGDDAIFPFDAIQHALELTVPEDRNRVAIGVDVARYGSDSSVICVLAGDRVAEIREIRGLDTMAVAGAVVDAMRRWEVRRCAVDGTGIGAGVIDRLREMGYWVDEWISGAPPLDRGRFTNVKAEVVWQLRERLLAGRLALVDHPALIRDLSAWRYEFDSSGRLRVVDPPRSPDAGDALAIAHWLQSLGSGAQRWEVGTGTLTGRLEW